MTRRAAALVGIFVAAGAGVFAWQSNQTPAGDAFRFRTGVELINVTATVTDQDGHFVPGLTKDDFRVFDNERPQAITHFSAERVPVSIGIMLDTSASMDGEKILAARAALDRFLLQLLDPADEVFLYRFDNVPHLLQGWTTDKHQISDAIAQIRPRGATSLYDTLADAVRMAQQGHNRKKAVLIISDGNDTSSQMDLPAVKQLIRQTEVLVYAIAIDDDATATIQYRPVSQNGRFPPPRNPPVPQPFPFPGGRRPPSMPPPKPAPPSQPSPSGGAGDDDRVNVAALRDITDDSGGRTEIIRRAQDLDPATAGIADELSRQYYMAYDAPSAKDGRWHDIRVEVRQPEYHVRARRGYVDSK
ncbi:MAG TPA: VWA domain-containing protein [Vicinamibacterales bacterium]|jgi:Ca-activated chloride channel family protein